MFIELHILQNFAPNNLNRDDTGAPKECTFGGYRRARISSQCLKRAIRKHFADAKLFPPDLLAVRTKRVVDAIVERLVDNGRDREAAEIAALNTLAAAGLQTKTKKEEKDGDGERTQYLLYLAPSEIARLAEIAEVHWDVLARAKAKPSDEDGKAKGKKAKKAAKAAFPKEVQEAVSSALQSGKAVDLALFGRMLADASDHNVNAACQVAHALSVNEVAMEMDFFTAVDDLQPVDTQGAGMLEVTEFNSSCFYRYAKLDLQLLDRNLRGDAQLARDAVIAFVRSSIAAIPSGKQNSMAAHNPPSYVRVLVRRSGEPWNLANAFARPIRVRRNGQDDIAELAVDALEKHMTALGRMYGSEGVVSDRHSSLYDPKSLSIPVLLELLEKDLEAASTADRSEDEDES